MNFRHPCSIAVITGVLQCLGACDRGAPSRPNAQQQQAGDTLRGTVVGYPSGPWWRGDVSNVLLGVAHVLITHQNSADSDLNMRRAGPASQRSEMEASALAQNIAKLAAQSPDTFQQLAQEYSEDPTTRPGGGRIGTVRVLQVPIQFVDALGNLAVGETSRVIQTSLGFHVIKRLPVEPEELVAGREILIQYQGTVGTRPARGSQRTRAEASELAERVERTARRHPEQFTELVAAHSDAWSRFDEGRLGDYSTYEPFEDAPDLVAINVLAHLKPGEMSALIEDASGFRLFKRTDPDHARSAFSPFLIAYGESADVAAGSGSAPRSRDEAHQMAEDALHHLQQHPEDFDEYRARFCDQGYCAMEPMARPAERYGIKGLAQTIKAAPVGGMLPTLVETPSGFLVARREDEKQHVRVSATDRFELPRPAPIDLASATPDQLVWFAGQYQARLATSIELPLRSLDRLSTIVGSGFKRIAALTAAERGGALATMFAEVDREFGAKNGIVLRELFDRMSLEVQGMTLREVR